MKRALRCCALLLLGCAPEAGRVAAPIAGGATTNEESVVYLVQSGSVGFCSGAVVGPRDILTVERCVTVPGSSDVVPANALNVGIGSSNNPPDRTVAVEQIFVASGGGAETLALVRTTSDLRLPVLPLPDAAPTMDQGVALVGFGRTEAAMAGIKHEGDATISNVAGATFDTAGPAFACGEGDDGGPAIAFTGEVVGVGGLPDGPDCPPTLNTYATVFEGRAFIESNLAPPLPDAGPPEGDAGANDAGVPFDAGDGRGMPMDVGEDGGCAVSRAPSCAPWLALSLLGAAAIVARRRRRRAAATTGSRPRSR